MKKCKYCQSEIDSKAKVCPQCGKKQGMSGCLIAIIVLVVICVLASLGGGDKPSSKNDDKKAQKSTETKKQGEKEKTSFETNETVTYKNVDFKVEKIERSNGSEFDKPEDGKEFLIVTINIKNNSDDKVSYNAYDWKLTNSNGQENDEAFTTVNSNALNNGDLAVGGTVTGTIAYEIPKGDSGLKLSYYDTVFDNKEAFYFNIK